MRLRHEQTQKPQCGVSCPVFLEGDCPEPQEANPKEVIAEHGEEDGWEILSLYDCFNAVEAEVSEESQEPTTEILDERICRNLLIVDESFINVSRAHITIK